MTRKIVFALFCLLTVSANAQIGMPKIFENMPDSIIPYLNATVRNEMMDYYTIKLTDKSKNLLGGKSYINYMNDKFADIQLTSDINMQLRLLTKNDSSQVLCLVKTFGKNKIESDINFYTTDWTLISGLFGLEEILSDSSTLQYLTFRPDTISKERYNEIKRMFEPLMITATIDSGDLDIITFSLSVPILKADDKKIIDSIKRQKIFKWTGEIFK